MNITERETIYLLYSKLLFKTFDSELSSGHFIQEYQIIDIKNLHEDENEIWRN